MSQNKNRMRSRVLIVDDHPAVFEALAFRIGVQRDLEYLFTVTLRADLSLWLPAATLESSAGIGHRSFPSRTCGGLGGSHKLSPGRLRRRRGLSGHSP
jgi:hypothetical protein